MNREIKFRAWDIDNQSMHYSDDASDDYIWEINNNGIEVSYQLETFCPNTNVSRYERIVVNKTLMQYTGLLDKNGKEIYEGDIVRDARGRALTVTYQNKYASYCIKSDDWVHYHWFGEACESEDVEVIGNIHNNPELMKGDNE